MREKEQRVIFLIAIIVVIGAGVCFSVDLRLGRYQPMEMGSGEISEIEQITESAPEEQAEHLAENLQEAVETSYVEEESDQILEEELSEEQRIAEESSKEEEEEVCAFESRKAEETKAPIEDIKAGTRMTKSKIESEGINAFFSSNQISDTVFNRMKGKSFNRSDVVAKSDLRYLKVLHYGGDGNIYIGELVCHIDISNELLEIFRELYNHQYPIEKMYLVDNYNADDIASAASNNSSCFNMRITAGRGTELSRHAYGKAIDINPLYNPYIWVNDEGEVQCDPYNADEYADRNGNYLYKLTADDFCVKLFKHYGFSWGGDWGDEKDYMHFSMNLN